MKKTIILVIVMLCFVGAQSQDTAMVNGKVYQLFNQKVSFFKLPSFSKAGATVSHELPPILGNYPDGEYVMVYEVKKDIYKKGKFIETQRYNIPYATFSIKNNKKNGTALFYNKDRTVYAKMNFKDDQLDQEVVIHDKVIFYSIYNNNEEVFRGYHSMYNAKKMINHLNSINTEKYKKNEYLINIYYRSYKVRRKMQRNAQQLLTLNYKDGLLEGDLILNILYKGDTFLLTKATFSQGELNGEYTHNYYGVNRKKLFLSDHLQGNYRNNNRDGIWLLKDMKGNDERLFQFKDGKCLYYRDIQQSYSMSAGKDSVLKYENDPTKRIVYPYYFENNDSKYWVMNYMKNNVSKQILLYEGKANINYFNDVLDIQIKDTIVNGQRYRFTTRKGYYNISHSLSKVNEDFDPMDIQNYVNRRVNPRNQFDQTIYDSVFNLKGEFLYLLQSMNNPFESNFSLTKRRGRIVKKNVLSKFFKEEEYYFPLNNKHYNNFTFFSKKNSLKKITHHLIGDSFTGALIRVFDFKVEGDDLKIVDTLWKANAEMNQTDEYLEYLKEDFFKRSRQLELYWMYMRKIYDLEFQKHIRVDLNGIPYNSSIYFDVQYRNSKKHSRSNYLRYKYFNKDNEPDVNIKLFFSKKSLKYYGYPVVELPENKVKVNLKRGKIFSINVQDFSNYFNSRKYSYFNNQLDGKVELNTVKLKSGLFFFSMTKLKRKRIGTTEYYKLPYDKGLKEGQWRMGDLMALNFERNKLNGLQVLGNSYNIVFLLNYQNDSLHGEFKQLQESGHPYIHGNFEHGMPNGTFQIFYNHVDSGTFLYKSLNFKNGYFDGLYKEYNDNNELQYVAQLNSEDSMLFSPYVYKNIKLESPYFKSTSFDRKLKSSNKFSVKNSKDSLRFIKELYLFLKLNSIESFKKADYTYFYKSGSVFKKGLMNYEKPVGNWKFYAENNTYLFKVIDFKDSSIVEDGTDTLHTYGTVKAYYENGQLMYKGLAVDKEFAYNCASGSDMPTENDIYLEFYDSFGNPMMVNDSGYVKELQVNGLLLKEGRIENGLKQGLWIYYSSYGLPTEMGSYKNGEKEGRWLSGDLGNINLKDDMCFMSDSDFREWIRTYGKLLSLKEMYYKNGKLISTNLINVKTN